MAGHSKWAQIKRQKAVTDAARGRAFAKLGREIAVAARLGGGEPEFNARLRTAIATAKAANMPAANIERAIQRGTGELPGMSFEEASYEGYGPGGVALYLECVTDNTNRTVAELRHRIEKAGGNLGQSGSVAWMFERKGRIEVDASRYPEDVVLEAALAAGAENLETEDGWHVLTTEVADFHSVQDALGRAGIVIEEAELAMLPVTTIRVEGKEARRLLRLVEELEDHDDVMKLWSNFEVDEDAFVEAGAD
ncbi:MAG: YebC/PmpR family DNA-binding transcriptional regulator [Gemmatimonadota bacterium]|nr:YebC/PmpR family DNA-binding transcriptional regulator [Gemmatimonadota bacterium]